MKITGGKSGRIDQVLRRSFDVSAGTRVALGNLELSQTTIPPDDLVMKGRCRDHWSGVYSRLCRATVTVLPSAVLAGCERHDTVPASGPRGVVFERRDSTRTYWVVCARVGR